MVASKLNNSNWYAIRTHVNQESRAEANLRAWQLETFFPKIKEQRRNQFSGAITSLERLLHKVSFVRGVQNVVSIVERNSIQKVC